MSDPLFRVRAPENARPRCRVVGVVAAAEALPVFLRPALPIPFPEKREAYCNRCRCMSGHRNRTPARLRERTAAISGMAITIVIIRHARIFRFIYSSFHIALAYPQEKGQTW